MTDIVWTLHDKMPGKVWEVDEIVEVQRQLEPYGFNMEVMFRKPWSESGE